MTTDYIEQLRAKIDEAALIFKSQRLEIERVTAERDAHAVVIQDAKAAADAALKTTGATTFTLLDLVQELVLQRDALKRDMGAVNNGLVRMGEAVGLKDGQSLVKQVLAVVAERDNAVREVTTGKARAADMQLALDGLHDQFATATRCRYEQQAARDREIDLFREEAYRIDGLNLCDPCSPIGIFREAVAHLTKPTPQPLTLEAIKAELAKMVAAPARGIASQSVAKAAASMQASLVALSTDPLGHVLRSALHAGVSAGFDCWTASDREWGAKVNAEVKHLGSVGNGLADALQNLPPHAVVRELVTRLRSVTADRNTAEADSDAWVNGAKDMLQPLSQDWTGERLRTRCFEYAAKGWERATEHEAKLKQADRVRDVLLDSVDIDSRSATTVERAEALVQALKESRAEVKTLVATVEAMTGSKDMVPAAGWVLKLIAAVDPELGYPANDDLWTALIRRAAIARGVFKANEAVTVALRQQGLTGPMDQCVLALCRDMTGVKAERDKAKDDKLAALAVAGVNMQTAPPVDG